jgi:16S rRNA (cytosine967-C5)-methyltransferase
LAAEAGLVSRRVAYRTLRRVHADGAWATPALRSELDRTHLDSRDRGFAANLAYETLRWEGTLDWALEQVSSRPLDGVDPAVLDVLRLGTWELLYGAAPDRAAVDTAVEVARREIGQRVTGFVNGVLRGLTRSKADLPWPDPAGNDGLALATGYPVWIVEQARTRFGDRAEAVLRAGNEAPGVTLRAVGDRAALLDELTTAGLDPQPGALAPEAVRVPGADPGRLAAVTEGRAVVQDEASMVVARAALADLEPGALVLDAAAGPGGKTTHLAQLGARVVAADVSHGRLRLVAAAAERTGLSARIAVCTADGTRPCWRPETFDVVLVDAPCSGLGVTRRRPELRWRRTAADVDSLARLQLALLAASAPLVRPGGRLVYSACTWTEAETRAVTAAFAATHPAYRIIGDQDRLVAGGRRLPDDFGVQLDPATDRADGMYVCLFRRDERG